MHEQSALQQFLSIMFQPDNIPIVLIAILVPFYTWYGLRQALATDRLILELEGNPEKAKTHHRKIHPFLPGWAREAVPGGRLAVRTNWLRFQMQLTLRTVF